MKHCLVTGHPELYSNQRFLESAVKMGITLEQQHPQSANLSQCDGALFRLGISFMDDGIKLARECEKQNIRTVNSSSSMALVKNKWETYLALEKENTTQVHSELMEHENQFDNKSYPLVLKTLYGSKGVGVHLCFNKEEAKKWRTHYASSGYNVIYQPFIKNQRELRVFVIGDRCYGIEKRNISGEFRANWHRGAKLSEIDIKNTDVKAQALKAMQVCGLDYGAVDFLESDEGIYLLEVNDSPGIEGIEKATGHDLATPIVELLNTL